MAVDLQLMRLVQHIQEALIKGVSPQIREQLERDYRTIEIWREMIFRGELEVEE